MSDKPIPPIPAGLTQEQVEAIAGGGCTLTDIKIFSEQIRQSYDNLVEFTTYMMERVAGKQ